MGDFLKSIGSVAIFLISTIAGFGSFLLEQIDFLIGLFAILVIIYIIFVLFSDIEDKFSKILSAIGGLMTGIFAAAALAS